MVVNPWKEYGEDAAHDGKSLQEALRDCETSYEREQVLRGYVKYYDDD